MRTIRQLVIPGAAVCIISVVITLYVQAVPVWIPFTYELNITNADPAGKVFDEKVVKGVRADGSTVRIRMRHRPDGSTAEQRVINDFRTRHQTVIDGLTESQTTYPINERIVKESTLPPQTCTKNLKAPHSNVLGYDTVLDRLAVEGDNMVTDYWRAPELNCLALQTQIFRIEGGNQILLQTQSVANLDFKAPPDSWFETIANYTERAPGAVMAEYNRRYPQRTTPAPPDSRYEKLNDAYAQQKATAQ